MEENILPNALGLQIDNGNIPYLTEAAKWGKFLAIIGFIMCGLLILTGFFAGSILAGSFAEVDSELGSSMSGLGTTFFAVLYTAMALLYFFPSLYLYNFASKMRTALLNNDQLSLNTSFKNLKSCLKFWGILFIIVLCLYAVIIVFGLFASLIQV